MIAGYTKPMEKLIEHNPGLRSRFPEQLRFTFKDYTRDELRLILCDALERPPQPPKIRAKPKPKPPPPKLAPEQIGLKDTDAWCEAARKCTRALHSVYSGACVSASSGRVDANTCISDDGDDDNLAGGMCGTRI